MDNKYEFYLDRLRTNFGEMDTGAVTQNYVEKGYMLKQATPITVNDSSAPVETYLLLVFEKEEEAFPLARFRTEIDAAMRNLGFGKMPELKIPEEAICFCERRKVK